MTIRSRSSIVALAAIAVMALAVGASARRFELSAQDFLATWPALRFEDTGGVSAVTCPVELEGSFHSRTLSKVSGQLIGYITRATINGERFGAEPPCVGTSEDSTATVLAETLPWHVRYQSFTGTLPTINTITLQLIGAGIRVFFGTIVCLLKSIAARPLRAILTREAGGAVTSIRADEGSSITTTCFGVNGRFSGTGEVWRQIPGLGLSTTRIRVTLVQ